MKFVAGVDCHKDTHTVAVLDGVGKLLCEFQIAADPSGYRQAIANLANHAGINMGLEGTGVYGRHYTPGVTPSATFLSYKRVVESPEAALPLAQRA